KVVTAYAVAGFILLQLCDIIFPALGIADEIIGYVLIALIALLPMVVAFSWMFEITPEGMKRTREVARSDSISQFTGQRINHIIIFLLSIALAFFVWAYFDNQPVETTANPADEATTVTVDETETREIVTSPVKPIDTRPSIAVLPFVNMSSDADNVYFSDGLSEEILNLLAQSPELRVAGRTSSFFYKNKNENLTTIGETLNVEHILEGSVRKAGNKVRITAQLISAHDGFHLWSKTYDRQLTDIFVVQDEIAGEVTRAMEVTLLSDGVMISDRSTTNPETYDLYLRAKKELYDRGVNNVRQSINLFRQAISLDTEYAPAYLDLAVAELLMNWNYGVRTVDESLEAAWAAVEKARELGQLNSDYYAVLGLYHSNAAAVDNTHIALAEEAFQKAVDMNPNNVRAYMWWATLESTYDAQGEKALALNTEARKLDPLNRVANGNHAGLLAGVGHQDEAIEDLKRLIRIDPEYDFYRVALTNLYLSLYDYVNAAEALAASPTHTLQYPFHVRQTFLAFNDEAGFLNAIDVLPVDNPSIDYIELLEMSASATLGELKAEADVLLLKSDPDFFAVGIITRLLEYGEYDLVRRLIENARVDLKSDIPSATPNNGFDTRWLYLSTIYKLGQITRARRYAEALLTATPSERYIGPNGRRINHGTCHLVLGNRNRAIEELELAAEAGWLGYYDELANDPVWQEIVDDPRLEAVRKRVDAGLALQKEDVYDALKTQGLIKQI
ncbi:MAG: hypothetical protein HN816_06150, partial [Gammaproteobacteria bacterium]|nr:hypothetical protein [Gammaproteobacteria bacterium]